MTDAISHVKEKSLGLQIRVTRVWERQQTPSRISKRGCFFIIESRDLRFTRRAPMPPAHRRAIAFSLHAFIINSEIHF